MNVEKLRKIQHTWAISDERLRALEPQRIAEGLTVKEACAINNSGYFILFFAQLEVGINETYEGWTGEPWEAAAFIHRVEVLRDFALDDAEADSIIVDYEFRCEVAHGRSLLEGVQIEAVAERYQMMARRLG